MTLYLYGGPKTRVSMPKWYMAEKGIAYEYVNVDLAARQNLSPSYLEVNPFGKLPALKDDSNELVLFESGAILQYLSENYTDEAKDHSDSRIHQPMDSFCEFHIGNRLVRSLKQRARIPKTHGDPE